MRTIALALATLTLVACSSTPSTGDAANAASAAGAEVNGDLKAAARAQLESLATAAVGFETQNGRCPQNVEEVASPAPNDPWGSPIAFMPKGPENPSSAFVSSGPDKELLTADDISVPVTCMGG